MILDCVIDKQRLKISRPFVVGDTIKYIDASFNFKGHEWDGLVKIAHFTSDGQEIKMLLDDSDVITADKGLNLSDGDWEVFVIGEAYTDGDVEKRIVTNACTIHVDISPIEDLEPYPEVTPTIGEQVIAQIYDAKNGMDEYFEQINEYTAEATALKESIVTVVSNAKNDIDTKTTQFQIDAETYLGRLDREAADLVSDMYNKANTVLAAISTAGMNSVNRVDQERNQVLAEIGSIRNEIESYVIEARSILAEMRSLASSING